MRAQQKDESADPFCTCCRFAPPHLHWKFGPGTIEGRGNPFPRLASLDALKLFFEPRVAFGKEGGEYRRGLGDPEGTEISKVPCTGTSSPGALYWGPLFVLMRIQCPW